MSEAIRPETNKLKIMKTETRLNTRRNEIVSATHCPHCGTPMVRVGEMMENAGCRCWWVGAQDGVYTRQVSVYADADADAAYRVRMAEEDARIAREVTAYWTARLSREKRQHDAALQANREFPGSENKARRDARRAELLAV